MSVPDRTRRRPAGASSMSRLKFAPTAPLTDRLFTRLCGANPDLRLEHSARGELIVLPPAGAESGGQNLALSGQLYIWVKTSGLGQAFDSSAGFTRPNGAIRSPDASWVAQDRWDALTPDQQKGFAPSAPTSSSSCGRGPTACGTSGPRCASIGRRGRGSAG